MGLNQISLSPLHHHKIQTLHIKNQRPRRTNRLQNSISISFTRSLYSRQSPLTPRSTKTAIIKDTSYFTPSVSGTQHITCCYTEDNQKVISASLHAVMNSTSPAARLKIYSSSMNKGSLYRKLQPLPNKICTIYSNIAGTVMKDLYHNVAVSLNCLKHKKPTLIRISPFSPPNNTVSASRYTLRPLASSFKTHHLSASPNLRRAQWIVK